MVIGACDILQPLSFHRYFNQVRQPVRAELASAVESLKAVEQVYSFAHLIESPWRLMWALMIPSTISRSKCEGMDLTSAQVTSPHWI